MNFSFAETGVDREGYLISIDFFWDEQVPFIDIQSTK